MWPDVILSWRPSMAGNLCYGVYQDGQGYPLSEAWFENGQPMERPPANALRFQSEGPVMPRPLLIPWLNKTSNGDSADRLCPRGSCQDNRCSSPAINST